MKIGLIGLGKMGLNLALNLIEHNHSVVGYDKYLTEDIVEKNPSILFVDSLKEMIHTLDKPRVIWVMVPSGNPTQNVIDELSNLMEQGDTIIDGGNSRYLHSIERAKNLEKVGIHLLDVGTSGGTSGARDGACLMIGGKKNVFLKIETLFSDIATKDGYAYMGKSGSGHFVKMVHNGIEYGMMQAIGEGFDLLEASTFDFDYEQVAKVWANGSIIEGLLMRMVLEAVKKDPKLSKIKGKVDDSGEGQWTIEEALKLKVSLPVITQALYARYKSKDDDMFAERIVAAMRNEFGGHKTYKKS